MTEPNRTVSPWWRAATIFFAVLMLIAATTGVSMFEQFKAQIQHLQTQVQQVPHIRYIAVLTDAQNAPALLVTLDPQDGALQVQRLNAVAEGREDSMQLWALSANDRPRSLGVLAARLDTLRLPVKEADLTGVLQLAISVEDKGGVAERHQPAIAAQEIQRQRRNAVDHHPREDIEQI